MRDITCFSANTLAQFENKYENIVEFTSLAMDASHRVFDKYSEADTQKVLRNGFDRVLGIDFKAATDMKRRQAWRAHSKEIASLIEDVLVDKMVSGIPANSRFMEYVQEVNIADGDQNQFFVNDNSLLTVSKFAGNHHDVDSNSVRVVRAA